MFLIIACRSRWAKMARLQSSLLLRRNHGNASKANPDVAAPYPEFQHLLLSADPTIKTSKKRITYKKKRESQQTQPYHKNKQLTSLSVQLLNRTAEDLPACFRSRLDANCIWCISCTSDSSVDNTQGLTWCCCKLFLLSTKEFFYLVQDLFFCCFCIFLCSSKGDDGWIMALPLQFVKSWCR